MDRVIVASPPAVRLRLGSRPIAPLRLACPEPTLGLLASLVADALPDCQIGVFSARRVGPQRIHPIRTIPYGPTTISAEAVGCSVVLGCELAAAADAVLLSCNHTHEAGAAAEMIVEVKAARHQCLVVAGGTDATFRPGFYISAGADIVVRGETEALLPELMRRISRGQDFTDLPNLVWRSPGGLVRCSPFRHASQWPWWSQVTTLLASAEWRETTLGAELHEGPPPGGVSEVSVYLETSRGCRPGDCGFCTCGPRTGGNRGYRPAPIRALFDHLTLAREQGVCTLQLIDDNLLARCDLPGGEEEILAFFDRARDMSFAWEFATGLQLTRLLRPAGPRQDILDALFSPTFTPGGELRGGYRLFVPLETALRRRQPAGYNDWTKMKDFGPEQALCLIDALEKAGVRMLSLGVMIGFPDDTMRDVEDTVEGMRRVSRAVGRLNRERLARGMPPMETHWDIMIYMLLPGTPDFLRNRHRILFGDDYETAPELLNFQTAAYWPDHFTPWELTEIRAEIARDFGGLEEAAGGTAATQHRYGVVG